MRSTTPGSLLALGLPVSVFAVAAAVHFARAPAGPVPYLSGGGIPPTCAANSRLCPDGTCQVPSTTSCGASCTDCTGTNPPNSTVACSTANGGTCSFNCSGGYHACGPSCALNTSTSSCGTSCNACPGPSTGSGSATCDGTSCGISCAGGYWQSAATACTSQSFISNH